MDDRFSLSTYEARGAQICNVTRENTAPVGFENHQMWFRGDDEVEKILDVVLRKAVGNDEVHFVAERHKGRRCIGLLFDSSITTSPANSKVTESV